MESEGDKMALWTTEELAATAKVSSAYLRRLLIAGKKLQGTKKGKTWIIADEEARRWMASREQKQAA